MWHKQLSLLLGFSLVPICSGERAIVDAALKLEGEHKDFHIVKARFGGEWPGEALDWQTPPTDDPLLCHESYGEADYSSAKDLEEDVLRDFLVLVPRGNCTFERKALSAQRLGAEGIIVYDTLASRYGTRQDGSLIWPMEQRDYECSMGDIEVSMHHLSFMPDTNAYDSSNDYILSSPVGYCKASHRTCASKKCLLTGKVYESQNTMQACCAWDSLIPMNTDPSLPEDAVTIAAAFVSMDQGNYLLTSTDHPRLSVQPLKSPKTTYSSLILTMMAVVITVFAAYRSSRNYQLSQQAVHEPLSFLINTKKPQNSSNSLKQTEQSTPTSASLSASAESGKSGLPSIFLIELKSYHAMGLMFLGLLGLIVTAFLVEAYIYTKVICGVFCAWTASRILIYPLLSSCWRIRQQKQQQKPAQESETDKPSCLKLIHGRFSLVRLISMFLGSVWATAWLLVGCFHPDATNLLFYWISQDMFAACIVVVFLDLVHVNSLRVITLLFVGVFLYDLTFVIAKPYMIETGESILIRAATNGNPVADPDFCERYPEVTDCMSDPIPILLSIPHVNDPLGASAVLGLADLILPGLLISFACRLDGARKLSTPAIPELARNRKEPNYYFIPMVIAKIVGLLATNAIAYLFDVDQPALLYIIPICMITILVLGREELKLLWDGPAILKKQGRSKDNQNTIL